MVGHSMTRAPRSSNRERRSADCEAARVIRMVLPVSAILGNLGKNLSRSHGEQFLPQPESQLGRAVGGTGQFGGDHARSIETRDQSVDGQPVLIELGSPGNGNLTTSAERAQEPALRRDGRTGGPVVQPLKRGMR